MSLYIDKAQDRWRHLNERERFLLSIAAVVTMVIIAYLGLWKPMHDRLDILRTAAPEAQAQLVWMRNQKNRVNAIKRQHTIAPAADILTVVESSITEHGLNDRISQLEPVDTNSARINFKDVNFNTLTKWISVLHRRHGISIVSATIDKTGESGLVSASLVLRRSD